MKPLTIDWAALEMAFEDQRDEFALEGTNYFDVQNGKVAFIDEEISSAVDGIIAELDEVLEEDTDWTEDAIRETSEFQRLYEDAQSTVLAAIKIDYGNTQQFERIPTFDSHDSFQWMRNFIETVNDSTLRDQLNEAISRRKPFRQFRHVLAGDRRWERQWQEFEYTRQREAIIEWLQSIDVQPANPKSTTYSPPPLPDLRNIMFTEVRRFVRFAREIEEVKRIALIGSLAADKEFPKDIDLLVTISNDCELAPLAKLARQLSGHMNSHGAGADVFLASEDGEYLGRTCPWRDCGPGFRTSCDALHCGLRPYLHDDLNSVSLKKGLITQGVISVRR